jgi:hypothetical protein
MDFENIKLMDWQIRFQDFVKQHKNEVINLYGWSLGKTTMAAIDRKKKDRIYYHDNRKDQSVSFLDTYPILKNLEDGLTVIIVTVPKLEELDNLQYFEVKEEDIQDGF